MNDLEVQSDVFSNHGHTDSKPISKATPTSENPTVAPFKINSILTAGTWELNIHGLESALGIENARSISLLMASTTDELNSSKGKKIEAIPENNSDIRLLIQPLRSAAEAAQEKQKVFAQMRNLISGSDADKMIDVLMTHLAATTGEFGSAPRMLVAKFNPQNVDRYKQFTFYDYTLSAGNTTEHLAGLPLAGATEIAEYQNLRSYSTNDIPGYFKNYFAFEDGRLGYNSTD